MPKRILWLE
ncbi:hypothetical protein YQE_08759, partial [Dendroctonus ponderosae]